MTQAVPGRTGTHSLRFFQILFVNRLFEAGCPDPWLLPIRSRSYPSGSTSICTGELSCVPEQVGRE